MGNYSLSTCWENGWENDQIIPDCNFIEQTDNNANIEPLANTQHCCAMAWNVKCRVIYIVQTWMPQARSHQKTSLEDFAATTKKEVKQLAQDLRKKK